MVIDGKKIAQQILDQIKSNVQQLPFTPKLIDVFVGSDPVIESYVNIKAKRAASVGIDFAVAKFPAEISQDQLCAEVSKLNATENLCGLIVQLPLPSHINKQVVLDAIDPRVDVDVITSTNLGKLFTGQQAFEPATAAAVMKILDAEGVELESKQVLVVGAGDLVGKPVAFLLLQRNATVTVANAATQNLAELSRQADVIISGTGVPGLIKAEMVRDGAVVIDAGTAESGGSITGDVDFANVSKKASKITPVPGGVGPMTVAMLLHNVVTAAEIRAGSSASAGSTSGT